MRVAAHGSTDIVQIAAGHAFNLVLTKEGKVFTWGRNEQGQVGTRRCLMVMMMVTVS